MVPGVPSRVTQRGNRRQRLFFEPDAALATGFERATTIGRPLGAPQWIADLERRLGRALAPRKRGPKPAQPDNTGEQRELFLDK